MEGKSFGEFTLSVVLYDEERAKVEHAVAEFQKLFTQHDGLLYEERYNLLNAFFATVPGNKQFNLRKQWALNSNYADLSFLFTVDSGDLWNPHLEREYIAALETKHGTPYYLNLHSGDVAHTLLLGATGSGKSFTLSFTLQSLQKYDPLTFIFDLGGSYQTLTRAFGGTYLNVGLKNPGFTINPFSLEPTHENMNFLYLFVRVLLEAGGRYELTPEDEKGLFAAIERAYRLPAEIRTLTNFASILGPLGVRLHRWTQAGRFGHIVDNPQARTRSPSRGSRPSTSTAGRITRTSWSRCCFTSCSEHRRRSRGPRTPRPLRSSSSTRRGSSLRIGQSAIGSLGLKRRGATKTRR
jgi:type IV secretory pathway VirB4 component